ncbi:MAG: RIP metalloprotease RseP [Deltaproteobacteria bacterium]|nr:RIP metalloprotease RseP [Deltaproteobacteria bacterium]
MLLTLISFIVLLLALIFVHELGHFLAARLLGVRVERFSLGFPPKIYSKKIGETEYQICWLPLGGLVKLFGEEPGETIPEDQKPFSFSHKPVWVKSVVVAAGPLFNLLFAAFVLWILAWVMGVQHLAPVLGPLPADGPAARAGLRSGDVVTAVDGRPVKYFDELQQAVEDSGGRELRLTVRRGEAELTADAVPVGESGRNLLGDPVSGWDLGLVPRTRPVVDQALSDKPADLAGVRSGDLIEAIDGRPVEDWQDVLEMVVGPEGHRDFEAPPPPKPLTFTILRDQQRLQLVMTPVLDGSQNIEGRTLFRSVVGLTPKLELLKEPTGPVVALGRGLSETWRAVELTYLTLARLVQRRISAKVMGGPILIAEIAGRTARSSLADFVSLMALISVNLAILNLVPLPILDGGQLLIFLVEGLRRKPLNQRFKEICQWVGVTALAALMIMVFYNDVARIVDRLWPPSKAAVTRSVDDGS